MNIGTLKRAQIVQERICKLRDRLGTVKNMGDNHDLCILFATGNGSNRTVVADSSNMTSVFVAVMKAHIQDEIEALEKEFESL